MDAAEGEGEGGSRWRVRARSERMAFATFARVEMITTPAVPPVHLSGTFSSQRSPVSPVM
ncbi:hypothetical protein ABZT03_05800 [Streptomyces sp. NPDC005574]|uniref:hypothetical protein n=1 Tax=Streptomyces sp. NPDC005574 TaxID=3156891 RepID=UPI0033AB4CD9